MERKLASIKKIRKLIPIQGADFIELAMVDDWTVVVKKGEFTEGTNCVFFEIDSLLPEEPRYDFLASSKRDYFGTPKYRLKTMKLRKVISQGLALPLSIFPEIHLGFNLGDDVTSLLKIIKYDPEFDDNKQSPGIKVENTQSKFPSFIPKTDQERIQNLPHYYKMYEDHMWEETLKLDGSSLTAYKIVKPLTWIQKMLNMVYEVIGLKLIKDEHFGVCSRNLEIQPSDSFSKTFINNGKPSEYNQSDFWKVILELNIDKRLPAGYALQGEMIGPKIQSNHEKVSANEFHIFDIYDIKERCYLLPGERHSFIQLHQLEDISHVKVSSYVQIFLECKTLDDLQKRVTGESINPGTISEGRVYKSCSIAGLSFKCISNQYLLKNEK
jgi:RNA ligase (TIGR02306 family)